MSKLSLKIRIPLIALIVLISLILTALVGAIAYFRLPVSSYYSASDKAFVIPGLDSDFVPQGMHYDRENRTILVSGYSADGNASSIYLVDSESYETKKRIELTEADGEDYTGHAGGVAQFSDYVYVAGSGERCLYVFPYDEMLDAENGARVAPIGSFSLKASGDDYVKSSFVSVCDGKLITGEFYREENYKTLDSHKLTTEGGDYNCALALEFSLDEKYEFGIAPTPERAYSLPERVQGLHLDGATMYLSRSYGLAFSDIIEYDLKDAYDEGTVTVLGTKLPLLSLDLTNYKSLYKIPPMSEEITMIDGKMLVMCESASGKYMFGKLTGGKWCYATDLSLLK